MATPAAEAISAIEERLAAEERALCERAAALEQQVVALREQKQAAQASRRSRELAEAEVDQWESSLREEVERAAARLNEQRRGQLDRCTALDADIGQKIGALQEMQLNVRTRASALDTAYDACVQRLHASCAEAVALRRAELTRTAESIAPEQPRSRPPPQPQRPQKPPLPPLPVAPHARPRPYPAPLSGGGAPSLEARGVEIRPPAPPQISPRTTQAVSEAVQAAVAVSMEAAKGEMATELRHTLQEQLTDALPALAQGLSEAADAASDAPPLAPTPPINEGAEAGSGDGEAVFARMAFTSDPCAV